MTVGTILFVIAWVNFAVFAIVAICIGGDALSGKVEDGHYFVSSHGRRAEVSPAVWRYSRIHTVSIFITHPIGIIIGGGLMALGRRRPRAVIHTATGSAANG